mmetsp:Transcript_65173/g.154401  ORF Transcript_65173/g.154401 Transcript_65173/m.154401 type:complete len:205 (-) Transcript_65173:12-626(-)
MRRLTFSCPIPAVSPFFVTAIGLVIPVPLRPSPPPCFHPIFAIIALALSRLFSPVSLGCLPVPAGGSTPASRMRRSRHLLFCRTVRGSSIMVPSPTTLDCRARASVRDSLEASSPTSSSESCCHELAPLLFATAPSSTMGCSFPLPFRFSTRPCRTATSFSFSSPSEASREGFFSRRFFVFFSDDSFGRPPPRSCRHAPENPPE